MSGTPSAVRRLKRFVGIDVDEPDPYRCRACEATYELQYHVCPECGGFSVEAR